MCLKNESHDKKGEEALKDKLRVPATVKREKPNKLCSSNIIPCVCMYTDAVWRKRGRGRARGRGRYQN